MNALNVPQGYQAVMPYLILHNAKDFMAWAMDVLGATEKMRSLRDDDSTIAHAELWIGESTVMVAEASEQWPPNTAGMFVYVANADAAYASALARGASSIMPPADMPYGRSCGVKDPFGNVWWPTQAV
ncbi:MAG TPA: VOC family protein [Bacteroidia bacterium]|nr:VOC family protein [Bacteroidia bacterium]